MSGGPRPADGRGYNVASGNARVGAQGVIHGDVYNKFTDHGDSPQELLEAGKRRLEGGSPGAAEEKFAAAFDRGMDSDEVCYYWALSLLSGKSIDEVGPEDLHKLMQAHRAVMSGPGGDHCRALQRISDLLTLLLGHDESDDMDTAEAERVEAALRELPVSIRREVGRHLAKLLDDMELEPLKADEVRQVEEERVSADRRARAPKFFEPDPAEPRRRPSTPPNTGINSWAAFVGGTMLLVLGAISGVGNAFGAHPAAGFAVVLLWASSAAAVAVFGAQRAVLRRRDWAQWREYQNPVPIPADPRWATPQQVGFANAVRPLLTKGFTECGPSDERWRGAWVRDTAGLLVAFGNRLSYLYGDGRVSPLEVEWLIRWYARETYRKWTQGRLYEFRNELRVPLAVKAAYAAGIAGLVAGTLIVFITGFSTSILGPFITVPVLVGGGYLTALGGFMVFTEQRRYRADVQDEERRFDAEWGAYQQRLAYLADRPSDADMARWLDLDKRSITTTAIKRYGLTHRDVIDHVVLFEEGRKCRRARVIGALPRYSAYAVNLFLLTDQGVRRVTTKLDFYTGHTHGEERMTFRYDAIGSVEVSEVGIRFEGEQRRVVELSDSTDRTHEELRAVILGQAFNLRTVDGRAMRVLIENFPEGFLDLSREDHDYMVRLAMESQGVTSALRILEAVAAEGKAWIQNMRMRRERRIRDFMRGYAGESAPGQRMRSVGASVDELPANPSAEG